jgi:hypothetical protein
VRGGEEEGRVLSDIGFGEMWDFLDNRGRSTCLRFRRDVVWSGDYRIFDATGQLLAVAADHDHTGDDAEIAVSRHHVRLAAVTTALEGWHGWATLLDNGNRRWISLAQIQVRIREAGLGTRTPHTDY